MARARLGVFYNMHDDFVEAETFLNGAMGALKKIQAPHGEREPVTYMELGNIYSDNDQLAEAEVMVWSCTPGFQQGAWVSSMGH